MKKAIAIRHVAFENLGSWESLIKKHYSLEYIDAVDRKVPLLDNQQIDLLIILGGPIGVYQDQEYPFINEEIHLLADRLKCDLPTIGICLGSQLMARALGEKVYPNHTKEIGWLPLHLTATESCKNQIFKWQNNGLAFQCHPEVNAQLLEHWWVGHAAELSSTHLSVNHLRNETLEKAPQLEKQASKCLQEWIEGVEKKL